MKISSNLIKSDNEMVIEIRQFDIFGKRTRRQIHNQKLLNLDLISGRNHQMNKREIYENENHKKPKLKTKLTQITI